MLCLRNSVLCALVLAVGVVSVYSGSVDVSNGLYSASWSVEGNNITVQVTALGNGYIGFGISPGNGMDGADILIAGVHANQTAYHFDTHGVAHVPTVDDVDNYELLSASENETSTTIRFRRALNTRDSQDLAITNSNQTIIWAIGGSDDLEWHFTNRGVLQLNLLAQ